MDVLSQLPVLFKDMEGTEGAQLIQNLMKFCATINSMDADTITAFHQALCLLQDSQPKGTILSRPKGYESIERLKQMALRRMMELLSKCPYHTHAVEREALIKKFQKAVPNIRYSM